MTDSASLLAQALELRKSWVVLVEATDAAPAKRVQIRRPSMLETMQDFYGKGAADRAQVDHVEASACNATKYVVGWDGFMLSDVLGPENGSSDEPAPFAADLWAFVLRDRIEFVPPVANALLEQINLHAGAMAAMRKNSAPSSTARPVGSPRATTSRKTTPKTR